jgi:hypothetical protein
VAYKHQATNLLGLSFHIYFSSLVCPSFFGNLPLPPYLACAAPPPEAAEPSGAPLAVACSTGQEIKPATRGSPRPQAERPPHVAIVRTKPSLPPPPLVALHICAALALCQSISTPPEKLKPRELHDLLMPSMSARTVPRYPRRA